MHVAGFRAVYSSADGQPTRRQGRDRDRRIARHRPRDCGGIPQQGIHVAISGIKKDHLEKAEAELSRVATGGARVLIFAADVRDQLAVQSLVDETARRQGGIDILVNNAGVGWFGSLESQGHDDWRRVIDTNVTGVFNCCKAAIPHLRRRGGGYIINISSLAGSNPFVGGASYCASKAALDALSEALMQEVRYDGIRVSTSSRVGEHRFHGEGGPPTNGNCVPRTSRRS